MYRVLYRKWRPETFDDVSGQEHITTTLKNEVISGRINHAYLFTGSRGTGKTTCAKILAKAVNCLNPQNGNPCGKCEICRETDSGSLIDIIEMDAASSRKIDDVRQIIEDVSIKPTRCKYKVYIVDEVHMLTTEAFNALLKTLEEPPEHVIFILATTEVHKLLPTILSRCQRFDFHRIPPEAIAQRVRYVAEQEEIKISDSAAMLIASVADGALRDALSLLDRCIAISSDIDEDVVMSAAGLVRKTYLYELANCVINKNMEKALEIIDSLYSQSKDMARLCDELISHFRALMLIKATKQPRNILIMSDNEFEAAQSQCDYLSLADIVYYMDVLSRSYQRMGKGTSDRAELEMAMLKLSAPELDSTTEALTDRITALEKAVKRGLAAAPSAPEVSVEIKPEEPEKIEEAPKTESEPQKKSEPVKTESGAEEEPKPTPKPAKSPAPVQRASDVKLEELYKNARPFPMWVEVVSNLKSVSKAIAAAFYDSTAYESGNYLLIDSTNEMAFELLKSSTRRAEVKKIILETTGKAYSLGPYKRPQKQKEETDPLNAFKEKLEDLGIKITEE